LSLRWKPGAAQKRPPAIAYRTVLGPDNQFCRVLNRPWSRKVLNKYLWDRTPLGLETATPCQPRAALAVEGSGKTLDTSTSKDPALHREAERDTTGSISLQHLVHTWIGACVQGKRRRAATLASFRGYRLKVRLTLWF